MILTHLSYADLVALRRNLEDFTDPRSADTVQPALGCVKAEITTRHIAMGLMVDCDGRVITSTV